MSSSSDVNMVAEPKVSFEKRFKGGLDVESIHMKPKMVHGTKYAIIFSFVYQKILSTRIRRFLIIFQFMVSFFPFRRTQKLINGYLVIIDICQKRTIYMKKLENLGNFWISNFLNT